MKRLLFSVSISDCRVDTFTVGGHGGAGKDTSNTGVRITHEPSGAVGRSTDTRFQSRNKALALRRLADTPAFLGWARLEAARLAGAPSIEAQVEEAMKAHNIRTEVKDAEGRWVDAEGL